MKTKLDKQLKTELDLRHREDYDAGSWGAATSIPYRVKTYLTRAQSGRIRASYEALRERVAAKLAAVPKSKQENREYELDRAASLCTCSNHELNALAGEKLRGWTLHAQTLDHVTFRNGRGHYELRPLDPGNVAVDCSANSTGWPRYDHVSNLEIYWDAEKGRYYVLEWMRARTEPVSEERRRRKWCRSEKKREFLGECRKLQERLLEAGVEIKSLVRDGGRWHDETYVECAAPDATVDVSERDCDAWNSHPEVQGPAEGPAAAEGGLAVPQKPARAEPEFDPYAPRVCFTGKLSVTRLEASNMAKAAGLTVQSMVDAATSYLVTPDPESGSRKNRAAKELGVRVIDEAAFMALCAARKGPGEAAPAQEV